MRGLLILGVLIFALAWLGWELRQSRQGISNVLFGFCGVLLVMLIGVLVFGVEQ